MNPPIPHPVDPSANLGDFPLPAAGNAGIIDCLRWNSPRHYTHAELDRQARACARGLLARGLARGDAVAILSANRAEYVVAYLAALRAGMVAVPVNFKLPRETIALVLRDCAAKFVFCDRERRAAVPAGLPCADFDAPGEVLDENPYAIGYAMLLDHGPFESVRPAADEVALVLYTSGSTGRPKGVPLTHTGLQWTLQARIGARDFRDECFLAAAPLFHINALGITQVTLLTGARLVLLPQFDVRHYIEAIGRFRCTWLTSVPTMLAMAVRETAQLARTDLSSVRHVRMGSAPLAPSLLAEVQRTFPGCQIANSYGTTEAGPIVFGPHPDGRAKSELALGWPVPGVEVRIVGPDGRDAEEGVLWQRTPVTMRGYLNLPEKTREVLTPDGWYVSGDIFRREDSGAYVFVGRADDMFVCGGENVFPGEVERVLETHPGVRQACVVAVPDEIKGEKPFAFVVAQPGAQLDEAQLRQFALANAPAYQHPRRVVFMDTLPLAGTNKVDRNALKARALELWQKDTQEKRT